jgi:hypothetical protein
MVNYQLGKIYKIVCRTTGEVYIGSTCEPTLARRLASHRHNFKVYYKNKHGYYISSFSILMRENYYIDLDEIEKYVDMTDPIEFSGSSEMKINIIKYEMVKLLVEVILAEDLEPIDTLGLKKSKMNATVPFKLAFNSLLNKKIIKHF